MLLKAMKQRRWRDASFARCERCLMLGFYSIRKLIESNKLTESLSSVDVPVQIYKPRKKMITRLNRHRIDDLYDLSNGSRQTRKLLFVCNQFIHSYVFTPVLGEKIGLHSVFLSSDRNRNQELLEIEISTIRELFLRAARDERTNVRMTYNPQSMDYDVVDA